MELTTIITVELWENFHTDKVAQHQLLAFIPPVMQKARWFGGKAWTLHSVACDNCLRLQYNSHTFFFFILEVNYEGGEPEYYLLPLAKTASDDAGSTGVLCKWSGADGNAYIMDATFHPDFQQCLFQLIRSGVKMESNISTLHFDHGKGLPDSEVYHYSANPTVEQSNSSIFYNDKFFF